MRIGRDRLARVERLREAFGSEAFTEADIRSRMTVPDTAQVKGVLERMARDGLLELVEEFDTFRVPPKEPVTP